MFIHEWSSEIEERISISEGKIFFDLPNGKIYEVVGTGAISSLGKITTTASDYAQLVGFLGGLTGIINSPKKNPLPNLKIGQEIDILGIKDENDNIEKLFLKITGDSNSQTILPFQNKK